MNGRTCLMCAMQGHERGPYCEKCWLQIATDLFKDYLLERIQDEGANVEHLRQKPPSNAELMQVFINLWEVKHTFRAGEVVNQ